MQPNHQNVWFFFNISALFKLSELWFFALKSCFRDASFKYNKFWLYDNLFWSPLCDFSQNCWFYMATIQISLLAFLTHPSEQAHSTNYFSLISLFFRISKHFSLQKHRNPIDTAAVFCMYIVCINVAKKFLHTRNWTRRQILKLYKESDD